MASYRKANVMWWEIGSMYIRCPRCGDIHRHAFVGDYQVEQYRKPHCGHRGDYKICFPLNGQYEIDKREGFYVRAGADPAEYFARFDSVETVDVSDKRKWYEAKEEVEMGEEFQQFFGPEIGGVNRLRAVVAGMIGGKVEAVRSYLETSSEKDIFLHGVEAYQYPQHDIDEWDTYQYLLLRGKAWDLEPPEERIVESSTGKTALHMAACEMYPEIVKLLLDYDADPNARTVDGRTPLMEAALWGRLDNVKHLLNHGADKSIQCVRKGVKLQAIDFAKDTKDNSKERYERSGGEHQVYKEVTYERDEDRKAIIWELSEETADDDHSGQASSILRLQGFASMSVIDGGAIISMLANFDVPRKSKTIGILFRSDSNDVSALPPVAAMSGWSHEPSSDLNVQIAGRKWTDEVFYLCRITGHRLPELGRKYDHDIPGQFYACHAEKQLIAYLVSRHVFLPCDIDDEDFGLGSLSLGEFQDKQNSRERVKELRSIEPPQRLENATILVSRRVCDDCRAFVGLVNETLGLNIQVQGANLCT